LGNRRRALTGAEGTLRGVLNSIITKVHLSLTTDAPIPRDAQRVGRVLALVDYIIGMSESEISDKDR
jgi:hypothetical protein